MRRLAHRHHLDDAAEIKLDRLLQALAAEPDPPTTVTDPIRAADEHLADSLSALDVAAARQARRIADLGAGAGFPGLALAAALPAAEVDLVEATQRKCEVIDRLLEWAGIGNARAVWSRAEDWARGEGAAVYDLVTARALASLPVLCEYAAPLLLPGGALVCWKGRRDETDEHAGDAAAAQLGLARGEVRVAKPFEAAHSRHLHVFVKTGETPERFPRRAGVASRRPLG